jgi:hypothetical protein
MMRFSPRSYAVLALSALLGTIQPASAISDAPLSASWVTDGVVYSVASSNNTVYIGGRFSQVGPYTGSGASVDPATGARRPFPVVDGDINALVPDGAGGWYVGGTFTQIGGVRIHGLAHVRPDGTLNAGWNPHIGPGHDPSVGVHALALSGTTLYVGGNFASIGSESRNFVGAVSAATGLPTIWDPQADEVVRALVVNGSVVYAGGSFTSIGGQMRGGLAALDAVTGLAATWNANLQGALFGATPVVNALLLRGTTLYVGGSFTSVGGQARQCLAALNTGTAAPTSWNPAPDDWVMSLSASATTLYAGGYFTTIAGQARSRLAAFDAAAGTLAAWNPNAQYLLPEFEATSIYVRTIVLSTTGVYVGGRFNRIGGQSRSNAALIDTATGSAGTWNPNTNGDVRTLALSGTNVGVGGAFSSIGGQSRNNLAAFDMATGSVTAWNPNPNGGVNAVAVNAATVYVGGAFTTIGGQARAGLASIDAASGILRTWNPNPQGGSPQTVVRSFAFSPTAVYVGGNFASIGGQPRTSVAALDPTTGNATAWNAALTGAGPQPPVAASIVLMGTRLFVGGFFTQAGGQARSSLAAFDPVTGGLLSWNPAPQTSLAGMPLSVNALASGGTVLYAGGNFTSIGGQSRNFLAALDPASGSATAFDPNVFYTPPPGDINDGQVYALALNGSTLFAGGTFDSVSEQRFTHLAAMNAVIGTPLEWYPQPNNPVFALALSGTTLSVGGSFQTIALTNRTSFAQFAATPIFDVPPAPVKGLRLP